MHESQSQTIMSEKALIKNYISVSKSSLVLYKRACQVLPDGCTRRSLFFSPYPLYIKRGEGCKVYDADGSSYIDYTNNLGPLILGHKHPKVMKAISEQLQNGTVLGGPTELEIELAEAILDSFPASDHVLFCASGTEANMFALRMLRECTGKDKFIMCEGAYHGSFDPFLKGSGSSQDSVSEMITVPFNDIESLEKAIKRHREELGGVFMEPIRRGIPPTETYLRQVYDVTRKYGVLLALDEVVTGFRLARGGAQERWGIQPDVTILGKILGGGFPIGAVTAPKALWKALKTTRNPGLRVDSPTISINGTWNGHPLAMAAGLATLKELTDEAYLHLEKMGDVLREGMRQVSKSVGIKTQIVGVGSIFNLYFAKSTVKNEIPSELKNKIIQRFYDLNMITRGVYLAKNHCSFISLPTTIAEVDQTIEAVGDVLSVMKPLIDEMVPELLI